MSTFSRLAALEARLHLLEHSKNAAKVSLTDAQDKKLKDLLIKYKGGQIPDKEIHGLADSFKMSPHDLESYIYGLASKGVQFEESEVNPGGRAEEKGVSEKDFPKATIEKGVKVEYEHTKDRELAKKITLDHLAEFPDYYDALEKMEKELKEGQK